MGLSRRRTIVEKVLGRCRSDESIGCWGLRQDVEIAHLYHCTEEGRFLLRFCYRNFSPFSAKYKRVIEVRSAGYVSVSDMPLEIDGSPHLEEAARENIEEPIGEMLPQSGSNPTKVKTSVFLSRASSQRGFDSSFELYMPETIPQIESFVDPSTYKCPC